MKKNLVQTLENNKIFKLVLGLGNQDFKEIENLVEIYALAGADMFDINPSKEAVETVLRIIEKTGRSTDDFFYTISTGVSGDSHVQKCFIDTKKCKQCGKCIKKCPRQAIVWEDKYPVVIKEKCIGCKKCDECKAISFCDYNVQSMENIVQIAQDYNLDCIELHLSVKKIPEKEIKYVLKNFKGFLSLCLDRKYYSNERVKKLINKVIKWKGDTKFIIQADGVPMSGGDNTFNSTLQAAAMAHLVQPFGTYIFMSGGTNEKTAELAKMCCLRYNGIGIGSYARKIVRNKNLDDAIIEAKKLIESCKND